MPAKKPENKKSEAIKKSDLTKPYEDRMQKTLSVLDDDFATIRVGRANPHVLDRITVNYYGSDVIVSVEK